MIAELTASTPANAMIYAFFVMMACYGVWLLSVGIADAVERIRTARSTPARLAELRRLEARAQRFLAKLAWKWL